MKKAVVTVFLVLALVVSVAAKEKEYQDGVVLKSDKVGVDAVSAIAYGAMGAGKAHSLLVVKIGEWEYGAVIDKKIKAEDWPEGKAVKVRFDINGGAVATRTKMFVVKDDGKEMELEVTSIIKDGKNYCGKRKCDPKNAEKEASKS